jgi:hypothetical protein
VQLSKRRRKKEMANNGVGRMAKAKGQAAKKQAGQEGLNSTTKVSKKKPAKVAKKKK